MCDLHADMAVQTPIQKHLFTALTHTEDIRVRHESDSRPCSIRGCAVLPPHKLVLTDSVNKKVKVVDTRSKELVEEISLDSVPTDIAVLPEDQIAVLLRSKNEIIIMTTVGRLSPDHTIQVKQDCQTLTFHKDRFYIIRSHPDQVLILDMQGVVQNRLSLDDLGDDVAIYSPRCTGLSLVGKLVYVTDSGCSTVTGITTQGELYAVYEDILNFRGPWGMVVLDDGSMLVCCKNSIHHISADLNLGCNVFDGLSLPRSICYNAEQSKVYVGSLNCDQINVFSLH